MIMQHTSKAFPLFSLHRCYKRLQGRRHRVREHEPVRVFVIGITHSIRILTESLVDAVIRGPRVQIANHADGQRKDSGAACGEALETLKAGE